MHIHIEGTKGNNRPVTNRFHNTLFSFSSFWLVRIVNWKLAKDETIYQGGSVLAICKREGKKNTIHINTEIKKKASKGGAETNGRATFACSIQYFTVCTLYPANAQVDFPVGYLSHRIHVVRNCAIFLFSVFHR